MEDPQLELADVKAQFVEAERRLKELAAELEGVASARETLDESGRVVGAAAGTLASTAADLTQLTVQIASAARAIEQAEPGAVSDRLHDVETILTKIGEILEKNDGALGSVSADLKLLKGSIDVVQGTVETVDGSIAELQRAQTRVLLLAFVTLVVLIGATAFGLIVR